MELLQLLKLLRPNADKFTILGLLGLRLKEVNLMSVNGSANFEQVSFAGASACTGIIRVDNILKGCYRNYGYQRY